MSNHPQADGPRPEHAPDPASGQASGQPWSTPSGDPLSADPFRPAGPYQASPPPPPAYQPPSYAPGYAAPPEPAPDYPPTAAFPAVPGGPEGYGPGGYAPPGAPVNYAPPGYSPDYGKGYPPPGHPQQPYPAQPYPPQPYGAPPGPPPRKSNAPLIAVIVAVTLLLCGGVATAAVMAVRAATDKAKEAIEPITVPTFDPELPSLPTGVPTGVPGSGRKITVTYEVTGDGPAQIVYLDRLGGSPTRLQNVKLPWKITAEVETPALLSVIAMRVAATDGSISCRALVDGEEVRQRTSSSGTFATTTCTHYAIG